jgi:hypothetical protein
LTAGERREYWRQGRERESGAGPKISEEKNDGKE